MDFQIYVNTRASLNATYIKIADEVVSIEVQYVRALTFQSRVDRKQLNENGVAMSRCWLRLHKFIPVDGSSVHLCARGHPACLVLGASARWLRDETSILGNVNLCMYDRICCSGRSKGMVRTEWIFNISTLGYVSVTSHSHLAASNVLMSSLGWWSWVLLLLILVVPLLTSGRKVNSY